MTEEEKRERIIQKLNDNVFVEAGAGAGKTTLIVSRIINQLKHGIKPDEIVVITFTNAAAEELRSRIIKKVRETCSETDLTEIERTNLTSGLQQLDRMNISTIHSFCLKLLRERIFDARLPMDAELLSNEEAAAQQKKYFTEWASNLDAGDWRKLDQCDETRYQLLEKMRVLFQGICELPDDVVICYDRNAKDHLQEAKQLVELLGTMLCQSWARIAGKAAVELKEIPDEKLGAAGKLVKKQLMLTEVPYFEVMRELSQDTPTFFNPQAKGDDREARKSENILCKTWWEQSGAALGKKSTEGKADYEYGLLLQYAIKARDAYRSARPLQNLTNDDLLQKTHRLICESKEARDYFAGKIRCLYVDEFQDTDQIQEEFIWKLAADKEDDRKLRDGALFLVGDPKQSIYRFRGAEPEVYFKAKDKMGQLDNAAVYSLDYNFRSNEKLIDWTNKSFAARQITSIEGYHPMTAKNMLPGQLGTDTLAGVYYYREPEVKNATWEDDIHALITLISNLVHKPYRIVDYKDQIPYERPITYSDFLVLCYSKKDMDTYRKRMAASGIPVQIYGEISLTENQAMGNYVRIYDSLIHPYDHARNVGALEALKNGCDSDPKKTLYKLKKETESMSAFGVAEYLLTRQDVLLPKNVEISCEDMLSVQTKLQQMFEKVLTEDCATGEMLSEQFWKYLETHLERELSLEETGNAVRFMNLHKAKGLEGQIVILAKRDEDISFKAGAFRKEKEYYPSYKNGNVVWSAYRAFPKIMQEAQKQEEEEMTRVQYVAVTRAKQALIVMDAIGKSRSSGTPCMLTGFNLKNAANVKSVESIISENIEIPANPTVPSNYSYESCIEESQSASYRELSPSALEGGSRTRQKVWMSMSEKEKERYAPKVRLTGNVAGTVIHRSLELLIKRWSIDFEQSPDNLHRLFAACAVQAVSESSNDIEEKNIKNYRDFSQKIQLCFARWAYNEKMFRTAREVYTEMPFSYYKEDEGIPVWMNGTADLIVQKEDGSYRILDYKSDYAPYLSETDFEISLKERYENQLLEYRYAVSRLFSVEEDQIELGVLSFEGDEGELKLIYTSFT